LIHQAKCSHGPTFLERRAIAAWEQAISFPGRFIGGTYGGMPFMKLASLVILLVAMCAAPVFAQDYPKAEVFGGYQFTHVEIPLGQGVSLSENFNGWNASATANVNKWFGVTGDFSGSYKSIGGETLSAHTYTFGPVLKSRQNDRLEPFVHTLFGGFHSAVAGASTNGFAMMTGGGVDAKVSDRLAVRLGQVDWVYLHAEGTSLKSNVRLSAGVVFRF
jgi:hypothetical protein